MSLLLLVVREGNRLYLTMCSAIADRVTWVWVLKNHRIILGSSVKGRGRTPLYVHRTSTAYK